MKPPDQAAALGRLFDYYLAVTRTVRLLAYADPHFGGHDPIGAEPATPEIADLTAGADWYVAEQDNICALVASTQLPEHAWRLAFNLRLLYPGRGKNAEEAAYLVPGLAAARAASSRLGAAHLLTQLACDRTRLDQTGQAFDCLREAAELFGDDPEPRDTYRLMTYLAEAEQAAGQPVEALLHLIEALSAVRKISRPVVEARAMIEIASLLLEQSAPEQALTYAQQAEDLMTANPGNEITRALVLQLLGKVHEYLGRLDKAASSLRRAIDISQSCGYRNCAAECHHQLGIVLSQLGQPAAAEQSLRVAVDLYRTLKLTTEAAQAAEDLNDLMTKAGSLSDQQTVMPTLA